MKIFFSVGEPSGDLHAANLIRRLRAERPEIECVGFGGPKMAAAGCDLMFDLTQLAVMFLWEALKNIRQFLQLARQAKEYFANHDVDAVVLIDYPGFNWWIARRAKRAGIPVFYYGVPQVWAWAPWRIRKIRKYVDHVLCKLPFEEDWFQNRGCHATYVGHPYFDQLVSQQYDESFAATLKAEPGPLLTLLPGSRDQEVARHLPILLRAAAEVRKQVPHVRVAVASYNSRQFACAEMIAEEVAHETGFDQAEIYLERTPELMRAATVCMACSGSVSLELMFHRKPTVIVYRLSRLFMLLQTCGLRVRFITLVNLIAARSIKKTSWAPYDPDRPRQDPAVMPEYLTTGDCSAQMAKHVVRWLTDPDELNEKVRELKQLARQYAKPGATGRAADYVLQQLGAGNHVQSGEFNPANTSKSKTAA